MRIFIGFLGLTALVSVFTFFNSFRNSSSPFPKLLTGSIFEAVDQDEDKDGLTNREESYWNTDFENPDSDSDGFLDGEEVASGHDPLIPGPDDIIDNGNFTYKLSNLTLAGLYEGSLKPDDPNYQQSLEDMAVLIMNEANQTLSPKLSPEEFHLTDPSNDNQETYLNRTSFLFQNFIKIYSNQLVGLRKNLNLIGSKGFDNKETVFPFQVTASELKKISEEILYTPVPSNWVSNHYLFLRTVESLRLANESIANGADDPIRASVGLNFLGEFLETGLPQVIRSYTSKMRSEKLNNEFFNSLDK